MMALITTANALLQLDLESGEHETAHDAGFNYYGLTWDEDAIYTTYMMGDEVFFLEVSPDLRGFNGGLLLNQFVRMCPHQLHYEPICSAFYMCLPGNACVKTSKNGADWAAVDWLPGDDGWCYYNSIAFTSIGTFVLDHGKGDSYVHQRGASGKTQFGVKGHNLWVENGELHTLSSDEFKVINERGTVYEFSKDVLARGIAIAGGMRVIGLSRYSVNRRTRNNSSSTILVLDMDWNKIKHITLPGSLGQVREIRLMTSDATTHNGLPPPGVN